MKNLLSINPLKAFLALFVTFAIACGTSSTFMASSALESGEVKLNSFKYVVIYDSAAASFMELELEKLLESRGFSVVGEKDVKQPGSTLGVKYLESAIRDGYGQIIGASLTITLENFATDKTLLTIGSSGTWTDRTAIWKKVAEELSKALNQFS